jgi:hypothetical protein
MDFTLMPQGYRRGTISLSSVQRPITVAVSALTN